MCNLASLLAICFVAASPAPAAEVAAQGDSAVAAPSPAEQPRTVKPALGLIISGGNLRLLPSGPHEFGDMKLEGSDLLIACRTCEVTNDTPKGTTQATCKGPLLIRSNNFSAQADEARYCDNVLHLSSSSGGQPASVVRHPHGAQASVSLTAARITLNLADGTIKTEDAKSIKSP